MNTKPATRLTRVSQNANHAAPWRSATPCQLTRPYRAPIILRYVKPVGLLRLFINLTKEKAMSRADVWWG